ncbi:MAG TPA: LapA family protein [Caldithrix sp.]|nr:LapA family protein [Caldithrix sp.]
MKILGNIIKILVVVLLVYVLIQNADQIVDLKLFTFYYPEVHFSLIILITLGIGAILGAVMMSFSIMQLRSEVRNLQRKNKQLTQELENLRNISVDEIPEDSFPSPDENES